MASNGHDATMNGLFRRNLARSVHSSETCPDSEILAAYYERSLDAQAMERCEMHFSQCARCREHLATMVRIEERPQPASWGAWLRDWRLLAATAAAVLVITVWGAHRTTLSIRTEKPSEPLVAMSQPEQPPAAQSAVPAQPPAESSQAGSNTRLLVPYSVGRDAAKIQAAPQTKPPKINLKLPAGPGNGADLPLNGRIVNKLREPAPLAKSANQAQVSESNELKKEGRQVVAAAPAASLPAAPRAGTAAQPTMEAENVNRARGAANDKLADNKADADNELKAKQTGPARRVPALATTLGGPVQLTQQHSGSTIIQTPDPKILWRVAGGNFVERTENSGASWHGQVADPDAELIAGSAPTAKVCWLVGKSGAIVVTKDATHWKRIPPPVPADFIAIEAKSASSAIVTAADGQKFSTDNEGKKWVPVK